MEQLVDRLKKGKYKSSNEILAKSKTEATCPTGTYLVLSFHRIAASVSEDDDIVNAGPQKMSLKGPVRRVQAEFLFTITNAIWLLVLSYMRITTPCRSALCVHSQCFDATSWFSMMEQTTTYMCPVCEKVLNYDDLIVDGCVPLL